jgi:hypothetical protein
LSEKGEVDGFNFPRLKSRSALRLPARRLTGTKLRLAIQYIYQQEDLDRLAAAVGRASLRLNNNRSI